DLLDDTAPLCRLNWPQWCQYTLAGDALQCQADLGETGEGQFVEGEWLEALPWWLRHFLLVCHCHQFGDPVQAITIDTFGPPLHREQQLAVGHEQTMAHPR